MWKKFQTCPDEFSYPKTIGGLKIHIKLYDSVICLSSIEMRKYVIIPIDKPQIQNNIISNERGSSISR